MDMKPIYQPSIAASKSGSACVFGISRTDVRSIDLIREAARALWPSKTAVELALRTGATTRTCEYWLAGRCGLSADALAALLRSDVGLDILGHIMGNARPAWWAAFKRRVRVEQLSERQAALRRDLDQLEQERAR